MKIHNVDQKSQEWLDLRLGKFTASDAQAIANTGKGLETLIFDKVAEKMTGKQKIVKTNDDIERGNEMEKEARLMYELKTGNEVQEVGFCELDDMTGCSPDGLVGEDGLIEIKCKNGANYARFLYDQKIDPAHRWQMQMQMYVTGRQWCDYIVYNEDFDDPMSVIRVDRDDDDITLIKSGLAIGKKNLLEIMSKITN